MSRHTHRLTTELAQDFNHVVAKQLFGLSPNVHHYEVVMPRNQEAFMFEDSFWACFDDVRNPLTCCVCHQTYLNMNFMFELDSGSVEAADDILQLGLVMNVHDEIECRISLAMKHLFMYIQCVIFAMLYLMYFRWEILPALLS